MKLEASKFWRLIHNASHLMILEHIKDNGVMIFRWEKVDKQWGWTMEIVMQKKMTVVNNNG